MSINGYKIEPTEIGEFISFHCATVAAIAPKSVVKDCRRAIASYMEMAMILGLLLARRQPELVDACQTYWEFTHNSTSKDFIDSALFFNQQFKETMRKAREKIGENNNQ